ncbi:Maf family protein [Rhodoluna sp. KAS3]|uniref:Maf family protein n=1 Tax=Rhodoluna sp. KAS3 TaxID=942880 RepID=UPI00223206F1|nr:Maf family protein [Rhodoluna sp. KAS3]BDS48670.1 hypothetical protein RKAS3_02470 [Rhodoluna sp. KAS3]
MGLIQNTADMVHILAKAKAEAVIDHPDARNAVIIGCDSSLEFDGEHSVTARARSSASTLDGHAGAFRSSVLGPLVIDNRDPRPGVLPPATGKVSKSIVHFADISDREIDAYVATGEPLKVAGAFTIDGLGGAFLKSIEGDAHTVIGLSLPDTARAGLEPGNRIHQPLAVVTVVFVIFL